MIQIMDVKDSVAIAGVGVTLLVSSANLAYSLWSNRQTSFVNTVTTARLKWIDSLRDKVSEFLAVTSRLTNAKHAADKANIEALSLQRALPINCKKKRIYWADALIFGQTGILPKNR
jgi:hypothetical protein